MEGASTEKGQIPAPEDCRERKGHSPFRLGLLIGVLVFGLFAIAHLIFGDLQFRDRDEAFTRHERTEAEAAANRNSPEIQYVGYAEMTRHYGYFSRRLQPERVDAALWCATVIYADRKYYAVFCSPERFFRSLLDKNKYPELAVSGSRGADAESGDMPLALVQWDRALLKSAGDEEALSEALVLLAERADSGR